MRLAPGLLEEVISKEKKSVRKIRASPGSCTGTVVGIVPGKIADPCSRITGGMLAESAKTCFVRSVASLSAFVPPHPPAAVALAAP